MRKIIFFLGFMCEVFLQVMLWQISVITPYNSINGWGSILIAVQGKYCLIYFALSPCRHPLSRSYPCILCTIHSHYPKKHFRRFSYKYLCSLTPFEGSQAKEDIGNLIAPDSKNLGIP